MASIHLSQGKRKVASINITQAIAFSALLILILSALCLYFIEPLARLLGSSDRLLPLAVEYMAWYIPFLVFYEVLNIGMFCIRLDSSPTYTMMCNAVAAILNIILDYIFIFELGWGIMGAAFATSLGTVVGGLMTLIYLLRFSRTLHLCRIKLSIKSLLLTLRNIGYMIKLGSSAFISEASIACMMFLGTTFSSAISVKTEWQHSVLPVTSSLSSSWSIMPLHNPHSRLSAITSSRTTRACTKDTASRHSDRFNLRYQLFHSYRTMLPRHRFVIH